MGIPCGHQAKVEGCRICHLWITDPRYRQLWGGTPIVAPRLNLPCVHLGDELTGAEREAHGLNHAKTWSRCENPSKPLGDFVCPCKGCGRWCRGYMEDTTDMKAPVVKRIGKPTVVGGVGEYFNGSVIRYKGELLFAYRVGWAGSNIYIVKLDHTFTPIGPSKLVHGLHHQRASHGREDPRLFLHNGSLMLSYTGVTKSQANSLATHQMYAVLNDDFNAIACYNPAYKHRAAWEKNWVFFSHRGSLYAIYSISPHVILKIDGNEAQEYVRTPNEFQWTGGHLRGGAAPVLHNGYFYHWYHGRVGQWQNGIYNIGCYKFKAEVPFSVAAQTPDPLYSADRNTRPPDQSSEPAVVFPAGAYIENGTWFISCGVHDRWTDMIQFDENTVELNMVV